MVEISDRDAHAANKALELLGKTAELRMWIDQIERGSSGALDFDRMSNEELEAFITGSLEIVMPHLVKPKH